MPKLFFKAADLQRVVDHALKSTKFGKGWPDDDKGDIILVHDQGVYLMSNGDPRDIIDGTANSYVAYAYGCNPNTDTEWWDTARELVGGDDFAELVLWAKPIKDQIDAGADGVTVSITETTLQLMPPRIAPQKGDRS